MVPAGMPAALPVVGCRVTQPRQRSCGTAPDGLAAGPVLGSEPDPAAPGLPTARRDVSAAGQHQASARASARTGLGRLDGAATKQGHETAQIAAHDRVRRRTRPSQTHQPASNEPRPAQRARRCLPGRRRTPTARPCRHAARYVSIHHPACHGSDPLPAGAQTLRYSRNRSSVAPSLGPSARTSRRHRDQSARNPQWTSAAIPTTSRP
jgi:hypothetical protein